MNGLRALLSKTAVQADSAEPRLEAWDSLGHPMPMMRARLTFGVRFCVVDHGQPQTIAQRSELGSSTRQPS